ncbi:MAG: PhnD/SsuA/transferrin family substrate-binding protein [Candidatus Thioglobus sp.]|nr:PhnD/SsuA/transferrin family substrate-binding protein [Candidatus Thioglobus sp.]
MFLALWLGFVSHTSIAETDSRETVSIAVQSFLGTSVASNKWKPTVDFLNKRLPNYHFELLIIEAQNVELLRQLVSEGKLDYVITQPVATAELQYLSNIKPILTKVDHSGVSEFGSVIITSALNKKINSLQDLKGKTFAGANPAGLGGWILGYDYLLLQGIDPYTDFSRVDFLGRQDNIVDAISKGMVDAGVIRTGVLERLSKSGKIQLSDIKVLDYKSDFPYILSTHLVPEWSFSATAKADPQITALVEKELWSASAYPGRYSIAKWTDVADYQVIHKLLKRHRISVYKDHEAISFLKKYYQFLAFLLMLVVTSIWYIRDKRVKKINKYKIELERLSRVSSVDQLLSEIAHEIAQPVTSIKIDAKVIEKLLKNTDTMSDSSIGEVVDSLSQKTDHCVDVINNIRSFLSTKEIVHESVNVNDRIASVLKLINHEISESKVSVNKSLENELPLVYMSTVEFDQVLLNLCKNSVSAMSERKGVLKVLTISTVLADNDVVITVKDTGHGVTDKENLFKLFKTNKSLNSTEGLGLGLSLSRSIIRSYDGDLTLQSTSSQGSTFLIRLPIVDEK